MSCGAHISATPTAGTKGMVLKATAPPLVFLLFIQYL